MPRRSTRCSDGFYERAKALFPEGGTQPDGNPGFERFRDGPLDAARAQFSTQFDELPYAVDDSLPTLRFVMTADVPLFAPMVFYAVLGTDGVVELVDVIVDPDYWSMLESDPTD